MLGQNVCDDLDDGRLVVGETQHPNRACLAVALLLRAPLIVVIVAAGATAGLVRLLN